MAWTTEHPFQALALTGGGFRGLFTAQVLAEIEQRTNEPLGRRFDLICGTSIGGIVAIAVAFEIPMRKVVEIFEERGQRIFPPSPRPTSKIGRWKDLFEYSRKPRYSVAPLREAIEALIPKDALLGDAKHPLAIPAVNVTHGVPQVFKTRHRADWDRDWRRRAVDIAVATSAAPTFFQLAEVDGALYADGGLFANAPDLVAIHEAEHFFEVPSTAIRLLSIGTTTKKYSISFGAGRDFGIADWMDEERLFSVMISSQQQFVGQVVEHRLGGRYVRLDHEPSQEQARDLGLDNSSDPARRTLKALASKVVTDVLNTKVAPFLTHTPRLKIVRSG